MAITEYIPQRPPFVMVDCLVESNENSALTMWVVPADGILVDEGQLQAAGLLENVAQTAAAWIGKLSQEKGEPIRIGYIGAVKEMNIHRLPKAGETIRTKIEVVEKVFDITLVRAAVYSENNEAVAETDLKIALV